MLRRRRGRDEDQPQEAGLAGEAAEESDEYIVAGPWDVNDDVPQADRIDFGCIQVPVADGCEVQVSMADDQPAWITVVRGDSGLQLQAFAAPKTDGLWADVRQEIAAEVAKAGGQSDEADGPFGVMGASLFGFGVGLAMERGLGWRAEENFESGITKTVRWYIEQKAWWTAILELGCIAKRVGLTQ